MELEDVFSSVGFGAAGISSLEAADFSETGIFDCLLSAIVAPTKKLAVVKKRSEKNMRPIDRNLPIADHFFIVVLLLVITLQI